MQFEPFAMTHCPAFDTLVHVAFCGPLYGTPLHLYPAEQFTDLMLPIGAGVDTL